MQRKVAGACVHLRIRILGMYLGELLAKTLHMNNLFRGLLAGGAAYKWGGGCLSTVLIFLLVYWLLGSC